MLVMTCKLGGVIRVGNDVEVAVNGRDQDRIAVSVVAPVGSELHFDGATISPLSMSNDRQAYYFSLRRVRRFRIDDILIAIWLPGDVVSLAADCVDCVHVGIATPAAIRVSYEHTGDADPSDMAQRWAMPRQESTRC